MKLNTKHKNKIKIHDWTCINVAHSYACAQQKFDTFKKTSRNVITKYELRHEISNNVVCAISKGSDQPAHMRSLIRAFADRMNILRILSY